MTKNTPQVVCMRQRRPGEAGGRHSVFQKCGLKSGRKEARQPGGPAAIRRLVAEQRREARLAR
jgi:hypothetical protein